MSYGTNDIYIVIIIFFSGFDNDDKYYIENVCLNNGMESKR